jgi:hypothetical protein
MIFFFFILIVQYSNNASRMAKGHTVYRASCCVPCVKWLNGVTEWEIKMVYIQVVLGVWCGNWWLMGQWVSKKINGTGVK